MHRPHLLRNALLSTALSATASLALAQTSPFVGTWQLDPAKSQLNGNTMAFGKSSDGMMTLTADGHTDKFKTDGNQYPTWYGGQAIWKQIDDHTWESTGYLNGQNLGTDTMTISSDGKTLTDVSKGTFPSGKAFDDTTVYNRLGEGTGLVGEWRSTRTSQGETQTMTFRNDGNGLVWEIPDLKASVPVRFDGQDTPVQGPAVPPGLTLAVTRQGPDSLRVVEKIKGEIVFAAEDKVSSDGRTLTSTASNPKTQHVTTTVWEKQ